ncbi:phage major capsid protein [Atopobiaceae bacterium HCP3S3_F7]|uniref:phage major capsid protein n=1 Tax=Bacillati TaxID=1783272 RepID=UPI003F8C3F2A
MGPKARRAAAIKAAQTILNTVKAEDRDLTEDERAKLTEFEAEVKECDRLIEAAAGDEALFAAFKTAGGPLDDPGAADDEPYKAKSLGDHWAHHLKAKGLNSPKDIPTGLTVGAPELLFEKAATDTQTVGGATGAYGPLVTDLDTNFVMPKRDRLVIADLLQSGTVSGSAIKYAVFGALEGGTGYVAEGGTKPQLHVADPTWVTDALGEIAGWFKVTDDMAEDLPYMVSEINSTAVYDLGQKEEQALLFGNGTSPNLRGITQRSGIQTATKDADTAPDAILKAIGKVQTATGMSADGIVMHPTDYEALRLNKDGNGQYFGGGYFQGQYGNGGVMENPPVWGLRTVVTSAIPAGKVLVGAFKSAKLFTKGGIRVESTNSNVDDFINDKITTRLRKREGLQVKYPAAFVYLDLTV